MKLKKLGKKGLAADFGDYFLMIFGLLFLILFVPMFLGGIVEDQDKETLQNLDSLHSEMILLDYLQSPVTFEDTTITMKELILYSVEIDQEVLFSEKTEAYLINHNIEGEFEILRNGDEEMDHGSYSGDYQVVDANLVDGIVVRFTGGRKR